MCVVAVKLAATPNFSLWVQPQQRSRRPVTAPWAFRDAQVREQESRDAALRKCECQYAESARDMEWPRRGSAASKFPLSLPVAKDPPASSAVRFPDMAAECSRAPVIQHPSARALLECVALTLPPASHLATTRQRPRTLALSQTPVPRKCQVAAWSQTRSRFRSAYRSIT